MNPAIHHPAWYLITSIITQSEFEESLRKPVVVSPPAAQFTNNGFSVVCLPDRWQISCDAVDGRRILALAKATFEKLDHTPVTAYGVNHDFHVETTKQIPSTLATIVRQTGLPFPLEEAASAEITYTAEVSGCTFKTVISPSPRGPNFLQIQNNAHFLAPRGEVKHFELGPLLDEAFQRNETRSQLMVSNLVNAIQGLK
jgi:hypothetical protein